MASARGGTASGSSPPRSKAYKSAKSGYMDVMSQKRTLEEMMALARGVKQGIEDLSNGRRYKGYCAYWGQSGSDVDSDDMDQPAHEAKRPEHSKSASAHAREALKKKAKQGQKRRKIAGVVSDHGTDEVEELSSSSEESESDGFLEMRYQDIDDEIEKTMKRPDFLRRVQHEQAFEDVRKLVDRLKLEDKVKYSSEVFMWLKGKYFTSKQQVSEMEEKEKENVEITQSMEAAIDVIFEALDNKDLSTLRSLHRFIKKIRHSRHSHAGRKSQSSIESKKSQRAQNIFNANIAKEAAKAKYQSIEEKVKQMKKMMSFESGDVEVGSAGAVEEYKASDLLQIISEQQEQIEGLNGRVHFSTKRIESAENVMKFLLAEKGSNFKAWNRNKMRDVLRIDAEAATSAEELVKELMDEMAQKHLIKEMQNNLVLKYTIMDSESVKDKPRDFNMTEYVEEQERVMGGLKTECLQLEDAIKYLRSLREHSAVGEFLANSLQAKEDEEGTSPISFLADALKGPTTAASFLQDALRGMDVDNTEDDKGTNDRKTSARPKNRQRVVGSNEVAANGAQKDNAATSQDSKQIANHGDVLSYERLQTPKVKSSIFDPMRSDKPRGDAAQVGKLLHGAQNILGQLEAEKQRLLGNILKVSPDAAVGVAGGGALSVASAAAVGGANVGVPESRAAAAGSAKGGAMAAARAAAFLGVASGGATASRSGTPNAARTGSTANGNVSAMNPAHVNPHGNPVTSAQINHPMAAPAVAISGGASAPHTDSRVGTVQAGASLRRSSGNPVALTGGVMGETSMLAMQEGGSTATSSRGSALMSHGNPVPKHRASSAGESVPANGIGESVAGTVAFDRTLLHAREEADRNVESRLTATQAESKELQDEVKRLETQLARKQQKQLTIRADTRSNVSQGTPPVSRSSPMSVNIVSPSGRSVDHGAGKTLGSDIADSHANSDSDQHSMSSPEHRNTRNITIQEADESHHVDSSDVQEDGSQSPHSCTNSPRSVRQKANEGLSSDGGERNNTGIYASEELQEAAQQNDDLRAEMASLEGKIQVTREKTKHLQEHSEDLKGRARTITEDLPDCDSPRGLNAVVRTSGGEKHHASHTRDFKRIETKGESKIDAKLAKTLGASKWNLLGVVTRAKIDRAISDLYELQVTDKQLSEELSRIESQIHVVKDKDQGAGALLKSATEASEKRRASRQTSVPSEILELRQKVNKKQTELKKLRQKWWQRKPGGPVHQSRATKHHPRRASTDEQEGEGLLTAVQENVLSNWLGNIRASRSMTEEQANTSDQGHETTHVNQMLAPNRFLRSLQRIAVARQAAADEADEGVSKEIVATQSLNRPAATFLAVAANSSLALNRRSSTLPTQGSPVDQASLLFRRGSILSKEDASRRSIMPPGGEIPGFKQKLLQTIPVVRALHSDGQ